LIHSLSKLEAQPPTEHIILSDNSNLHIRDRVAHSLLKLKIAYTGMATPPDQPATSPLPFTGVTLPEPGIKRSRYDAEQMELMRCHLLRYRQDCLPQRKERHHHDKIPTQRMKAPCSVEPEVTKVWKLEHRGNIQATAYLHGTTRKDTQSA